MKIVFFGFVFTFSWVDVVLGEKFRNDSVVSVKADGYYLDDLNDISAANVE